MVLRLCGASATLNGSLIFCAHKIFNCRVIFVSADTCVQNLTFVKLRRDGWITKWRGSQTFITRVAMFGRRYLEI